MFGYGSALTIFQVLGHSYIGQTYIGHNYIGHNYIGSGYIGHNWNYVFVCSVPARRSRSSRFGAITIFAHCVGHEYTGHNYIGHNYIAICSVAAWRS